MMRLFTFSSYFGLVAATPSVQLVATVPGTETLENIAVRQSGDILVTSITSNAVHQVSPEGLYSPIAVATMPGFASLLGIHELHPDIFYVAAANVSNRAATPGSNGIWKLDLRDFEVAANGSIISPAEATFMKRLPDAGNLNGMAGLSSNELLLADSNLGTVNKYNVVSKEYRTVIDDPSLKTVPSGIGVGVNGVHIQDGKLFFTSLDQGIFAAVPISRNGSVAGPIEVIASGIVHGDDFALTPDGHAWIAENGENELVDVDIGQKTSRIGVNSTLLGESSAAAYAGSKDGCGGTLYVTGAQSLSTNSTVGSVVRVEL